jgi:hypothetical protein
MRRTLVLFAAALALLACDQIKPDTGGTAGASGSAGAAGTSAAAVECRGFRDITGACATDLSCLETSECDAATADSCSIGVNGKGACFANRCIYVNDQLGCGSPSDCPCGICGVDGRCYEDRLGTCGGCATTGNPGHGSGTSTDACKSCLQSCQGAGPACCSGAGCICEGQCEGFI